MSIAITPAAVEALIAPGCGAVTAQRTPAFSSGAKTSSSTVSKWRPDFTGGFEPDSGSLSNYSLIQKSTLCAAVPFSS